MLVLGHCRFSPGAGWNGFCQPLLQGVEVSVPVAWWTSARSDTVAPWAEWGEASWVPRGHSPAALTGLPSHSLCSLGPITREAWQGSEEEASATAGSECSSVVGKFEKWPG